MTFKFRAILPSGKREWIKFESTNRKFTLPDIVDMDPNANAQFTLKPLEPRHENYIVYVKE